MIEVEIKVHVTDEQISRLTADAQFIKQDFFVDTYYDSADFKLTTNGFWLRKRNEQFELKFPATKNGSFHIAKNIPMHEISDEQEIMQMLGLGKHGSLPDALETHGYIPLYRFENTRQVYKKDGFTIDLDRADFGDLVYCLCEIETMVESQDQSQEALEKLYAFINRYGISSERAEGKLGYYIRLKNPAHYQAVISSSKHTA